MIQVSELDVFLARLNTEKYYGKVVLHLEAGQIVRLGKDELIKDLSYLNEQKTELKGK